MDTEWARAIAKNIAKPDYTLGQYFQDTTLKSSFQRIQDMSDTVRLKTGSRLKIQLRIAPAELTPLHLEKKHSTGPDGHFSGASSASRHEYTLQPMFEHPQSKPQANSQPKVWP